MARKQKTPDKKSAPFLSLPIRIIARNVKGTNFYQFMKILFFSKIRSTFCALLFVLCAPCFAALPPESPVFDWEDPPQGAFSEDWMEVHLAGEKAGYAHFLLRREGDVIHTEISVFMKMARGPVPLEIQSLETTRETVDGKPLSFLSRMEMSGQPTTKTGTIKEGKVTLTTEGPGHSDTKTFQLPADALMIWGISQYQHRRGFEAGTKYPISYYSPSLSPHSAVPGTFEVLGKESVDYRGTPLQAIRSALSLRVGVAEINFQSWSNEHGHLLIQVMDMPGMSQKMILVDEETALADFVPPELFLSNLVRLDKAIPSQANRVIYRIRLEQGDIGENLPPESDNQRVAYEAETQTALVTVTRSNLPNAEKELDAATKASLRRALIPNLFVNSEHKAVLKLLSQIEVEENASSLEAARALRDFVYDYIDKKSLSIAFASASEVAKTAEGDCSEHAVLLAALGRAQGIPSRAAVGLMYVSNYDGRKNIMGYHMWNQFYIDGRWIDFDATLDETIAGPERLALDYSYLDNESVTQTSLNLLDKIGNLRIEIVETTK